MIIKRNLYRLSRLKILDIVFYCLSFRALSLKNAGSIYETVLLKHRNLKSHERLAVAGP